MPSGIELGQPGDDDGGEAVAGREAFLQAVHDAGDFAHAGQAGQAAAHRHDKHDVARQANAGVTGCLGIVADDR